MPIPEMFRGRLALPLIGSPMFLASGPELVLAQCKAGALSSGRALRAAEVMGGDLGYMGTRFIATREAAADAGHKDMIVRDSAADIVYTPVFSGIWANYLKNSVRAAGIDPDALAGRRDGGKDDLFASLDSKPKAWKEVWSAGQGIGSIHDVPTVAALVDRMKREYAEAAALPAGFADPGSAAAGAGAP